MTGAGNEHTIAPERLSTLIGLIYDCTIEPDRWPETMREICADLGCFVSAIYMVEQDGARVTFFQNWNAQPEAFAMLARHGEDLSRIYNNPQLLSSRSIDEPLVLSRDLSREIWAQVPYFRQWTETRGVSDSIQTMVLREPLRIGVFAANRHKSVGPRPIARSRSCGCWRRISGAR